MLVVVALAALPVPANASPSGVVISEFRAGGTGGANDEFVELLNTKTTPVDISAWRLQICANNGSPTTDTPTTPTPPATRAVVPAGTVLAPGEHYLFANMNKDPREAPGQAYTGAATPDQVYGFPNGIYGTGGVRILGSADVEDRVASTGNVNADCREGPGVAFASTGDQSMERRSSGTQDTDNNAADFVVRTVANPQARGVKPPDGVPSLCDPTNPITCLPAGTIPATCTPQNPSGCLPAAPGGGGGGTVAPDPGRWTQTGETEVPLYYYQGVTNDTARHFFFDGIYSGLYRTNSKVDSKPEEARKDDVIPPQVRATENYNHIGDITWDSAEGGRVLLPLECYYPAPGANANTCQTGSIGVADSCTLEWKYYVMLDTADIKKVMWNEVSPDGTLLWTQAGDGKSSPGGRDLIAYNTSDIKAANAAPTGPKIKPVRRVRNIVPNSGITGASFYGGKLFVAGQDDGFQVWSIDLDAGTRRLEISRSVIGESEGITSLDAKGGYLHWLIQPYNQKGRPTYDYKSMLLSFVPVGVLPPADRPSGPCRASATSTGGPGTPAPPPEGPAPGANQPAPGSQPAPQGGQLGSSERSRRLRISVRPRRATAGATVLMRFHVTYFKGRRRLPARGSRLAFAGKRRRVGQSGIVRIRMRFAAPGRYRATAVASGRRTGSSQWVQVASP